MSANGQRCEQPARGPTKWGSTANASRRKGADALSCARRLGSRRPRPERELLPPGGTARGAKGAQP